MCSRSFVCLRASLCIRSAAASPLWFRSFSNSQPLDVLALCSLESRHYSELLLRFYFAFPTLSLVFTFPRASVSSDVPPLRIPSFVIAHYARFTLFSLTSLCLCSLVGRSCCTSIHNFVFRAYFSDFYDTHGSFLSRIRYHSTVGPGTSSKSPHLLLFRFQRDTAVLHWHFYYISLIIFPFFRSFLSLFVDKFGIIQI